MTSDLKKGLPPASIIFTGENKVDSVHVHKIVYAQDFFEESERSRLEVVEQEWSGDDKAHLNILAWYDVRGIHDTRIIEEIGKQFNIHGLVLEDVVDVNQRPKVEDFPEGVFFIIKALDIDAREMKVKTEQVSLFLNAHALVSFQETDSDLFGKLRYRLQQTNSRIRQRGVDYLAYALIDLIVDDYFTVLEKIGRQLDELEEKMTVTPADETKRALHLYRKELHKIKRLVYPLKEAINKLFKLDNDFIDDKTRPFLRDLQDNCLQIIDMLESDRDTINSLQDLLLSEASLKMNKIMEFLTIISSIFIPLTFFTGVYGMNFVHMPELQWRYGYFALLGLMLLIVLLLLGTFRYKKWL